jgi:hypothetical protein
MHWTLEPKRCASLAVVWIVASVVLAWASRPFPLAQIGVGVLAGTVVGLAVRDLVSIRALVALAARARPMVDMT